MRIQGRKVLVTGAARRVGRAIAEAFAKRGAQVAVHYHRSAGEARATAADLAERYGVETTTLRADLSKVREVRALAEQAWKTMGGVDVLVNSASTYEKTPFGAVTERDWDFHFDANAKGPFFLSQALGLKMKKAGGGVILNIADWAALRPYAGYAPYCASKAALYCLNTALAKALAPEVRVNAVLPGPVLLPEGLSRSEQQAVQDATLLKRLGSPQDVAEAAAFLVEGSDFITGAALAVDGGRLIA